MFSESSSPAFRIRMANIDDVSAMTDLHCLSFHPDDHVHVMLGKHYVRATYRWLVTSGQSYALVAESANKILGIIAVCDGPFTRPMFLACLPEFFWSIVRSPGLLFKKKMRQRLFRRPDVSNSSKNIADYPGFAQMTIGVVSAECRGMGIFPALVVAIKDFSKARGARAIRAGIYKTNQPSRRVFIKGNWIETQELDTGDTVFYVHYIDSAFPLEIGVKAHGG